VEADPARGHDRGRRRSDEGSAVAQCNAYIPFIGVRTILLYLCHASPGSETTNRHNVCSGRSVLAGHNDYRIHIVKKLLLASCLVLAGLVPAKADSLTDALTDALKWQQGALPKDVIGTWCHTGAMTGQFKRSKDCSPLKKVTITREGLKEWEGYCKFFSVHVHKNSEDKNDRTFRGHARDLTTIIQIISLCEEGEDKKASVVELRQPVQDKSLLSIERRDEAGDPSFRDRSCD